jgi:hypothetical protein
MSTFIELFTLAGGQFYFSLVLWNMNDFNSLGTRPNNEKIIFPRDFKEVSVLTS